MSDAAQKIPKEAPPPALSKSQAIDTYCRAIMLGATPSERDSCNDHS